MVMSDYPLDELEHQVHIHLVFEVIVQSNDVWTIECVHDGQLVMDN
jgi:hypothetical protein